MLQARYETLNQYYPLTPAQPKTEPGIIRVDRVHVSIRFLFSLHRMDHLFNVFCKFGTYSRSWFDAIFRRTRWVQKVLRPSSDSNTESYYSLTPARPKTASEINGCRFVFAFRFVSVLRFISWTPCFDIFCNFGIVVGPHFVLLSMFIASLFRTLSSECIFF